MDAEQDAYARIYYDSKFRAIVKRMQLYPPIIKKKAFKVGGNFKGTFYDYISTCSILIVHLGNIFTILGSLDFF